MTVGKRVRPPDCDRTTMPNRLVPWLTSGDAAIYLGFKYADGAPNLKNFYMWKASAKPRTHWLGGRMRFRQVDLDACVEAEPESERKGKLWKL